MTDHNQVIAHAAKAALLPLGYVRKGRSRLWLKDYGFWLGIVEFQPSGFERGSYLNVAAHWLWGLTETLSLDWLAPSTRTFISFRHEAQFIAAAGEQGRQAAAAAMALEAGFASLAQITDKLVLQATGDRNGWAAFHAGVASGLTGDRARAQVLFDQTLASFSGWRSDFDAPINALRRVLDDPAEYVCLVEARIGASRAANRLPPALYPLAPTLSQTP